MAFDDLDHEGGRLARIAFLGQQMRDDLVDRPDESAGGKGMGRVGHALRDERRIGALLRSSRRERKAGRWTRQRSWPAPNGRRSARSMETLLSINRLLRSPGHGSNMPRSKPFFVG